MLLVVMRNIRPCFVVTLLYFAILLVYESIVQVPEFNYYRKTRNYISKPFSDEPKTILLWNGFFGNRNWDLPANTMNQSFFKNLKCPVTSCVITSQVDYLDSMTHFDAVVFHAAESFPLLNSIPSIRTLEQLYVFVSLESPAHTKHDLSDETNFYNLTMTYRLDSDVVWPYGNVEDIETGQIVAPNESPNWREPNSSFDIDSALEKMIHSKDTIAAWFASHCQTLSKRGDLIRALQKYIQIDVYGKCGSFSCPRDSTECDDKLDQKYKFYLSFENSLCTDYVTEKLFNIFKRNIVPVVYGGADYNRFAPPHSYINAQDFKTAEELADYLMFLDKNPKEYRKYFWWKSFYRIEAASPYCQLCTRLNNPTAREKVQYYSNIEEWWYGHSCYLEPKIKF